MKNRLEQTIDIARSFIGTPYKYGVRPEEIPKFFDCSSFIQYIYKKGIGINLERSTILQATQGTEIPPNEEFQIGDLLFFRGSKGHYNDELFPNKKVYIGHVAIYSGNGKAIHAASPMGVIEEDVSKIVKLRGPVVMVKRIFIIRAL